MSAVSVMAANVNIIPVLEGAGCVASGTSHTRARCAREQRKSRQVEKGVRGFEAFGEPLKAKGQRAHTPQSWHGRGSASK